jgi:hypothetical protein
MHHRLRALPDLPFYESLGTYGMHQLPIELEPDGCYVAAAAPLRGDPQLLSLSVRTEGRRSRAHSEGPYDAALLTFCARGATKGTLEVEVHGSSVAWLGAVWQVGRIVLGEEPDGR